MRARARAHACVCVRASLNVCAYMCARTCVPVHVYVWLFPSLMSSSKITDDVPVTHDTPTRAQAGKNEGCIPEHCLRYHWASNLNQQLTVVTNVAWVSWSRKTSGTFGRSYTGNSYNIPKLLNQFRSLCLLDFNTQKQTLISRACLVLLRFLFKCTFLEWIPWRWKEIVKDNW